MRKFLILLCMLFIFGCNNTNKSTNSTNDAKEIKIGIAKIISHPALDAVEKGVIDELTEQGFTNIKFDIQSANGELSTAGSIATKFKSDKLDVAVGIATPMAVALANAMKDTPIVFGAITDPIGAGLRKSNSKEDSNITGVTDMTPVKEQIELMNSIKPLKKLGHIYNSGEANSIALLALIEKTCKNMEIELITTTVTNTSEVKQAAEVLANKGVDAIYVGTDNVVAAALKSVTTTAMRYNIPVVGADPVTSENSGTLIAYGIDYYKSGRQVGKQVARILHGEKAGDIEVKNLKQADELMLYKDLDVAKKLGIEFK